MYQSLSWTVSSSLEKSVFEPFSRYFSDTLCRLARFRSESCSLIFSNCSFNCLSSSTTLINKFINFLFIWKKTWKLKFFYLKKFIILGISNKYEKIWILGSWGKMSWTDFVAKLQQPDAWGLKGDLKQWPKLKNFWYFVRLRILSIKSQLDKLNFKGL